MNRGLIDPVTLTVDLLTPKAYHFEYTCIPILYTKFEHFGIIRF